MGKINVSKLIAPLLIALMVGSLFLVFGFIIPLLFGYPLYRIVFFGVMGVAILAVSIPIFIIENKK